MSAAHLYRKNPKLCHVSRNAVGEPVFTDIPDLRKILAGQAMVTSWCLTREDKARGIEEPSMWSRTKLVTHLKRRS